MQEGCFTVAPVAAFSTLGGARLLLKYLSKLKTLKAQETWNGIPRQHLLSCPPGHLLSTTVPGLVGLVIDLGQEANSKTKYLQQQQQYDEQHP